MKELRTQMKGYHPFLIAFVDAEMDGEQYSNLFASNQSHIGLGIVSTANVPDVIVPRDRMAAYFLYYLAHQTLGFIAPDHKNHDDSRGCIFDRKIMKRDLLASMRSRALCDECRRALLAVEMLSPGQLSAANKLYAASGSLLSEVSDNVPAASKVRVLIGSSTEGLPVAREMQSQLQYEFEVEVWNQGTVFGLGTSTLEALEAAVLSYDFGVFIFTPDDETYVRGQVKQVARDNVVFELGLFTGKLSRKRAFVIQPRRGVVLPSDLAGITTATYDQEHANLSAALGPACQEVRRAIAKELHRTNEQARRSAGSISKPA
jgi:predicted nucleotide-binding protein